MSNRSPASQLAHLKVTYPLWEFVRVDRIDQPPLFEASRQGLRLRGISLTDLENQLIRHGPRW